MRKGDLVRLSTTCFTVKQGGVRQYPLSNYANDEAGTVEATRLATQADIQAWRESDASRGIDCAGESKLPPTAYKVKLHRDRLYTLLRARCRPSWSYRQHPGMALVLCTETGEEAYIKRELLAVVS
tara:strand:- start:757 stop:1134 length:378 start_codon:yes stop_codon:yes gene_type:complete